MSDDALRVLVTGGSGFLGNATINALLERHRKWQVTVLDLHPPISRRNVDFEKADVTDIDTVDRAFRNAKPDVVVHTAGWVPSGQDRYSSEKAIIDKVYAINYEGTKHVVEAARKHGCRAFVYTSSCTVISDDLNHDYPYMNETIPTGYATLPYGASKVRYTFHHPHVPQYHNHNPDSSWQAHAERHVLEANSPSMRTCALRPATIIGPGDTFGVIATIHACIAKFETPWIIGSGDNMYDFVYITNVADAHVLAVENLLSTEKTAAGEAFFVSNQEPIYFRDFMVAIWAEFGHVPPFQVKIPMTAAWVVGLIAEGYTWLTGADATLSRGSVRDAVGIRYSNNEKAKRVLGYVPRVGFAKAVKIACAVCHADVLGLNRTEFHRITSAY